jgi:hypothetical protein
MLKAIAQPMAGGATFQPPAWDVVPVPHLAPRLTWRAVVLGMFFGPTIGSTIVAISGIPVWGPVGVLFTLAFGWILAAPAGVVLGLVVGLAMAVRLRVTHTPLHDIRALRRDMRWTAAVPSAAVVALTNFWLFGSSNVIDGVESLMVAFLVVVPAIVTGVIAADIANYCLTNWYLAELRQLSAPLLAPPSKGFEQ